MTEEDFYHVAMAEENIMSICLCTHSVIKKKKHF